VPPRRPGIADAAAPACAAEPIRAVYTGRYLLRHGLDRGGLTVTAEFATAADRPARVGSVRLQITVPCGVPPRRADALLAVASHCTVHNTLRQPPEVSIELGGTR